MLTAILALLVGFFTLLALMYLTRGSVVRRTRRIDGTSAPPRIGEAGFSETFQLLTGVRLAGDNRVEILVNGDGTFDRLERDLRSAERTITWHTFWMKPGRTADRFREVLAERARADVRVLFLRDYFGAWGFDRDYFDALGAAGAELAVFRPPSLRGFYKLQHRMHTRAIVIDGRIGYTGGFGIDDRWLGDGRTEGCWRDTNVRCEGPVVDQLQAAFLANWVEATGDLVFGEGVLGGFESAEEGGIEAGILYAAPSRGSTAAERHFALAISGARERLYLTNAYFVPDTGLRRLLCEAVARGVDVRVLTPGRNTDRKSTWYAARAHYEELLEGGVRIYEYQPTMVHAKTLVADGEWASVGTVNFDNRSLSLNDEIAVVLRDPGHAKLLDDLFLEDLHYAREVDLASVKARGVGSRIAERLATLVAPLL